MMMMISCKYFSDNNARFPYNFVFNRPFVLQKLIMRFLISDLSICDMYMYMHRLVVYLRCELALSNSV